MPNTGTRAALGHLPLPVYNVETSAIHKVAQLGDKSQLVNDRGNSNSWLLDAVIEDELVYRALHEFTSNASWTSAVPFSSLAADAIEMNGIYSLINGTVKQGGEPWAEGQWSLSGKYPRIKWIVDGDELTTDWDTLDDVDDGAYTDLRNDSTDGGGVSDAGAYIQITAGSTLQWGDWWDSSIDWSCTIDNSEDNGDLRFYWRKCTAASSHNGGYYLEYDSDNEYLRVHYIDTAGTDTVLYTYAYTLTGTTTYYLRIVAAGHRFDIYFGTATAEYLFTVFDDRLTAGQEAIYNGDGAAAAYIDDVVVAHHKPVMALLPAGAYAWNDIPHQPMLRLGDNCTAYGRGQTVIAPQGNISFKVGQSLANMPKTEGLWIYEGNNYTIYDQSGHERHLLLTDTSSQLRNEQGLYNYPHSFRINKDVASYYEWADPSPYSKAFSLNQGFTVHLLFKYINDGSAGQAMLCELYSASGVRTVFLLKSVAANYYFYLLDSGGTDRSWDINSALTSGDWQLATFTFDGALTYCFYLNGVYQSTNDEAANCYFDKVTTVRMGYNTGATYSGSVNEQLLHVLSYEQTAAEIAEYARQVQLLRNDQAAVKVWDTNGYDGDWDFLEAYLTFDEGFSQQVYDLSKYNRAVTETSWTNKQDDGTDGWQATSYHKNALYCYHYDGAADYVTLGTNPTLTGDLTLMAWIKLDAGATASNTIIDIRDADNDGIYFWVNASSYLECQYNTVDTTYSTALVADRWYYVAAVINKGAGTCQLYLNGVAVGNAGDISAQTIATVALARIGATSFAAITNFFDGFMDDTIITSNAADSDRILWLYQHMPALIDESGWTQVFSADHQFVGDMVIDNGQIRLSQTFRQINGSATYHTKLSPYLWGYSDGHWWVENRAYPLYYAATTADYLESHTAWQLTKLDKYCVEVKGRVASTNEWLQYKIAVTQSPIILITEDQYQLQGNVNCYMGSRYRMDDTTMGVQTAPRFANPTLLNFADGYINGTVTGTAPTSGGHGLSLGLHREVPLVWLFNDTRYTSSVQGQINGATGGQYSLLTFISTAGIDFDAAELPHQWLMGMVPFSQANMVLGGDPANWTNENGNSVAGAWANINNGQNFAYSSGNLMAGNVVTSIDVTVAAAGSYRAWFLLMGNMATEDGTIAVTNAAYYSGSTTVTNVPVAGAWYSVDCICGDADIINYTFQKTSVGATEIIWIGEVVLVPLSNSKNFPVDVWLQALKQSRITESASK